MLAVSAWLQGWNAFRRLCSLVHGSKRMCLGLVEVSWSCLTPPAADADILEPQGAVHSPGSNLLSMGWLYRLAREVLLFWGRLTGLKAFLKPPGACEFRPLLVPTLKSPCAILARLVGYTKNTSIEYFGNNLARDIRADGATWWWWNKDKRPFFKIIFSPYKIWWQRHQIWKFSRMQIQCNYVFRYENLLLLLLLQSSSSYRAGSTDIPDPLTPLLPIVHRPR